VEFSGISEFIDTPVRRYSSGMNARLGFSIAAHLNPDVLIIDEVLAVGDFAFQQRAFQRIRDMVNHDVAAVLVSHQLERVSTLCNRALLLSKGAVLFEGPASDTIAAYVADAGEPLGGSDKVPIAIDQIEVIDGDMVKPGGRVCVRIAARVLHPEQAKETAGIGVRLRSLQNGQIVFGTSTTRVGLELPTNHQFHLDVDLEMNVEPGVYSIETGLFDLKLWKPIANGPRVSVTVAADSSFVGKVYARPTFRVMLADDRLTNVISA
jgi:energy-coupling factor transporter ATP-binding protein EcfA2